jgi:hypothetical protein
LHFWPPQHSESACVVRPSPPVRSQDALRKSRTKMTSRNLACFVAAWIGFSLPGCISFIPDHVDPASLTTAERRPDLADDEWSIVLQLLSAKLPPNADGSACAGFDLRPSRYDGHHVSSWHFLNSRGAIGGPVPEEMFGALALACRNSAPWPAELDLPSGWTTVDDDVERRPSPTWHGEWSCSHVVFAPLEGLALVECAWSGGGLAGTGSLFVFVRSGDGWSPLASSLLWES